MKRALVSIGVDKTGGALPRLRAAAMGAQQFADWGRQQGFDVFEFTDMVDGQTVRSATIFDAINAVVKDLNYQQLVVFFSGHGLLRAPGVEIWLLSGAPDNPNEAVDVAASIALARFSGIPHIVFISDACRSNPPTTFFSTVSGAQIFPNVPLAPVDPEIDIFYATRPGDPSLEVPPDQASNEFRAIFSSCLLPALKGQVAGVISNILGPPSLKVVSSRLLKPHLVQAVPKAASTVSMALRQIPDIRVESDISRYLSDVTGVALAQLPLVLGPAPSPGLSGVPNLFPPTNVFNDTSAHQFGLIAVTPQSADDYHKAFGEHFGDVRPTFPNAVADVARFERAMVGAEVSDATGVTRDRATRALSRLIATKGRESFETSTGFTVVGTSVSKAVTLHGRSDVFVEQGATQIRVDEQLALHASNVIVIRFGGGNGTAAAVLPGYIGTVVVEDLRVVAITYTPSRNSPKYANYLIEQERIDQRRAFAAVAARNSMFTLEKTEANDTADYIRMGKSFDPTLGIYAAYAYLAAGNFDGVKSVFNLMSDKSSGEYSPVPFDIAMLARFVGVEWPASQSFAPYFPMMTAGWSYVSSNENELPVAALRAGKHLVPALWTTFNDEGVRILEDAFPTESRPQRFIENFK